MDLESTDGESYIPLSPRKDGLRRLFELYRSEHALSQAVMDVAAERGTHADRGWTVEYDAAEGYKRLLMLADGRLIDVVEALTDEGAREQLVKAASLIVAAIEVLDAEGETPPCGLPVGRKPYWLGEDQWDQCYCLLPKGHEGSCKCRHDSDER